MVSDSWIWQNQSIGEYDNAWLLWYMTQDSQVTLLYRADRNDLFRLLLEHFPQALVALALLLAFGLWHESGDGARRHEPCAGHTQRAR